MLGPRMDAIIALLGKNKTVADIGCDHGKVSVCLLKNKAAEYVYATDISDASLQKAKELAKREGLSNIAFLCGDGFSVLEESVDAAVIAGMGGEVIKEIIKHPNAKTKLVLQPMKDTDILYQALCENGFSIENVVVVREGGRFYVIILAVPGKMEAFDYSLPPLDKLKKDGNARSFLEHEIYVLSKAAEGVKKTVSEEGKIRLTELNNKMNKIREVLKNAYSK